MRKIHLAIPAAALALCLMSQSGSAAVTSIAGAEALSKQSVSANATTQVRWGRGGWRGGWGRGVGWRGGWGRGAGWGGGVGWRGGWGGNRRGYWGGGGWGWGLPVGAGLGVAAWDYGYGYPGYDSGYYPGYYGAGCGC
jgi:hypothetical protein